MRKDAGERKSVLREVVMRRCPKLHRLRNPEIFLQRWRSLAYSSYHSMVGHVHYAAGQRAEARREFSQAIALAPFRPVACFDLAHWLDTWLGTRLGPFLLDLRWWLPDIPKVGGNE